ncbi:MAG: alanine-zipper protein [Candidatus Faecivicinus sp.]|nr:alanine-zipper protein [Candidatus Faecivicinus sp.]
MNDEMRAPMRAIGVSGTIVFPTGVQAELADILSVLIEEGADGALLPGAVLSARYTVLVANDSGQWREGGSIRGARPLVGSTIQLFIAAGEKKLPLGVFQVDSVRAQERSGSVVFSGSDSIASELGEAFQDALAYPKTLQQVWEHWLSRTRYEFAGTIPNGDAIIDSAPDWNGASLRSAAGMIAQAAGCFVRVNRSGSLEMVKCAGDSVGALTGDDYFSLEEGFDGFGPIQALSIVPADAETATRFGSETGDALEIDGNPLMTAGGAHFSALAEGLLSQLTGLEWTRASFVWRGDPALEVGMRVTLTDTYGAARECAITRQTLRFDGGFSATVQCEIPQTDTSGVPRAITPEGGVNADRLVGAVDGGLLRAGTVVARALAAGSVTAEKIASGAITADKIAAGALTAEEIRALTAHLEKVAAEELTADALYAALAKVQALAADSITADTIQTDALAAALGRFVSLYAGTGEFDLATIQNLLSNALILQEGVADSMMITNLAVTSANLLNATIDKLVLKGSDGKYYRVFIGADGTIQTEEVTVTDGEIEAGETGDGRQIVATTANVGSLNATTVKASQAIIGTIFTESLTAGKITANEALIASMTAPLIYTTAITALGNSLDLSANESIRLTVQGVRDDIDEVSAATETALGLAEVAQESADNAQETANGAQESANQANERASALETQLTLTQEGLSIVRTETIPGLESRVETIESGVHISGSEIGIYASDSPFRNTITNNGWVISEDGAPIITCAETKLTAPRITVSDAFIIGGLAWKSGEDKHVRLLKYGRLS